MLLLGLRRQRHSFCLSSKKFSFKKEISSAKLAVYVFKNCACAGEKLKSFFNHRFSDGDVHSPFKFR